jgi:peptidoglycan hydrolase-like protein with peptidoglycan-binding domain
MPGPQLQHGDRGTEVARAQGLLNRAGALLDEDGQFGPGTEAALRTCQQDAARTVTGIITPPDWDWLEALPAPCPDIATAAVAFIAREEVSGRAHYDAVVAAPSYPGGDSGITIGVGYDLRFEAAHFAADWGDRLDGDSHAALVPWLGRQGSAEAVAALGRLRIAWAAAWFVFTRRSLPAYVAEARAAFPNFDALPLLSRGALVSLAYNRGTAMQDGSGVQDGSTGDRRLEMRQIRDALAAGRPDQVPAALLAMQRLWPTLRGLRDRRAREAALFQEGLDAG